MNYKRIYTKDLLKYFSKGEFKENNIVVPDDFEKALDELMKKGFLYKRGRDFESTHAGLVKLLGIEKPIKAVL